MKKIRITMMLTASLLIGLGLCSCKGNVTKAETTSDASDSMTHAVNTSEGGEQTVTDSILEKKVDSLMVQFIDVSRKINEAVPKIDELKKEFEECKTNNTLLVILIVCEIAEFILIVAFVVAAKKSKRWKELLECIDNTLKLQNECSTHNKKENGQSNNMGTSSELRLRLNDLLEKVCGLDSKLSNMMRILSVHPLVTSSHTDTKVPPVPPISRLGYFGIPIRGDGKGYFRELLETKDETARFSAKISESGADFEPITSLSVIKSSDAMGCAVQFEGVPISRATDMIVKNPGIAIKKGEKWIIKQKASVRLS